MFVYDEFGSQYNPEGLAARERQHQSAQDHRSRWPRKIATAGRSWGVTNGNDRAARWPTPAQVRVAFGISSKAGSPRRREGRILRTDARTMCGASTGGHPVLSSLLEPVSDQRFRRCCAIRSTISTFLVLSPST